MKAFQFCLLFGIFVVDVLAGGPTIDTSPSSQVKPRSRFDYL
jgi:hypothetical protein